MTTQEAPLKRNLSDILCFIWNIGWLIIFMTVAVVGWYYWPKEYISDWPGESSSDRNCWHSGVFDGVFRGHRADRIRRIATYRGDKIDRYSRISVFASIRSTGHELNQMLNSENFGQQTSDFGISLHPKQPDWFPLPEYYVGTIEENGDTLKLFIQPGDNHLYLAQ